MCTVLVRLHADMHVRLCVCVVSVRAILLLRVAYLKMRALLEVQFVYVCACVRIYLWP